MRVGDAAFSCPAAPFPAGNEVLQNKYCGGGLVPGISSRLASLRGNAAAAVDAHELGRRGHATPQSSSCCKGTAESPANHDPFSQSWRPSCRWSRRCSWQSRRRHGRFCPRWSQSAPGRWACDVFCCSLHCPTKPPSCTAASSRARPGRCAHALLTPARHQRLHPRSTATSRA